MCIVLSVCVHVLSRQQKSFDFKNSEVYTISIVPLDRPLKM